MTWAVWLGAPVVVTLVVAIWSWWRGRPSRRPATAAAMRAHQDYLDALVVPARGHRRAEPAVPADD